MIKCIDGHAKGTGDNDPKRFNMKDEICPCCGKEIEARAEGECCSHCLANEDEMYPQQEVSPPDATCIECGKEFNSKDEGGIDAHCFNLCGECINLPKYINQEGLNE